MTGELPAGRGRHLRGRLAFAADCPARSARMCCTSRSLIETRGVWRRQKSKNASRSLVLRRTLIRADLSPSPLLMTKNDMHQKPTCKSHQLCICSTGEPVEKVWTLCTE